MIDIKTSPSLKLAVCFIPGIVMGSLININIFLLIVLLIAILSFLITCLACRFSIVSLNLIAVLLTLTAGMFKSNFDFHHYPENSVKFIVDTKNNFNDKLMGIIDDILDVDSSRITFIVNADTFFRSNDTSAAEGKVYVTVSKDRYKNKDELFPYINAGSKVILKGKLLTPDEQSNPGEFNYREYLELHGIYKIFRVNGFQNVKLISDNNAGFYYQKIIYPAKIFAQNVIDMHSEGDIAAYLKGLVTGDRSDISGETKSAFIDAGVMHLIAVSGLNVGYIILFITLTLSILRIPVLPRVIITILVLIFYCSFTGNSPSIMRATVMGIVLLISFLLERRQNFFNSIGIALMIILVIDSRQIYDAGFILSFSAVISMAVIYSVFEKIIVKKISMWNFRGKKITIYAFVLFFTSLAAQIGTLPITASYFGKISIISLFANVIAVPAANLSLAIGFLQIITALISGQLAAYPAEVNNLLLNFQLKFIQMCSSISFAYINVPVFSPAYIITFYVSLFVLLNLKTKADLFKKSAIVILFIILFIIYEHDFEKRLRVEFINVGQGDCALIKTPCGKVMLVDCGMLSDNYNSGERTILPYLIRQGINKIDILFLTHLHADHIGGLNYLLENIEIDKIIDSGQKTNSDYINESLNLIKEKNVNFVSAGEGNYIDEIDNLRIYFLFPNENYVTADGKTVDNNLNNGSLVFLLKYGECEILFTGDIEKEAEHYIAVNYGDFIKSDLLKTAHHGSITSSTIPFLYFSQPEAAVISCGKHNKFNHPSDIICSRLKKSGADVYRTDKDGAVIFETDGYKIENIRWK